MGRIAAVEAFKEAGIVHIGPVGIGVGHGDDSPLSQAAPAQGDVDGPFVVAILDGIVDEDVDQFIEALTVAFDVDAVGNGRRQGLFGVNGQLLEGIGYGMDRFRQVHVGNDQVDLGSFAHLGQHDEVLDQVGQAADLLEDAVRPLALAIEHLNGFGVGRDDGNRCLEFVPGVSDETLLVLHVAHKGTDSDVAHGCQDDDI